MAGACSAGTFVSANSPTSLGVSGLAGWGWERRRRKNERRSPVPGRGRPRLRQSKLLVGTGPLALSLSTKHTLMAPGVDVAEQLELPTSQRMERLDDSKSPRIVPMSCS